MRNSACHDSSKLVWNTKLHYSITSSVLVTDLSIAILPVCFWLHRTERLLCSNKLWHIAYNGNRQYNTSGSKLWTLLSLYRSAITSTYSIYDNNHQWHLSNLQFLNYKCNIEVFSCTYIVESFERNNTHNTGWRTWWSTATHRTSTQQMDVNIKFLKSKVTLPEMTYPTQHIFSHAFGAASSMLLGYDVLDQTWMWLQELT